MQQTPTTSHQKKFFVTGIGTEIGKTVCSALLVKYFDADYWKPIQSGDLDYSDQMKIRKWIGENVLCHQETYLFCLAASPHQSALEEGITINLNKFKIPKTENHLIIEGAGGLMVPLNDQDFMIDLIDRLNVPVVLVVRNYLGCINHTLLSLLALKQRNIELKYLILNGGFPMDTERIICKNIEHSTSVIRIPEITDFSPEHILETVQQMKIEKDERA